MQPLAPVDTAPLFLPLHRELMTVLGALAPEQWERRAVGSWRVRDVAAHILDGHWRRLSVSRDGHTIPPTRPIESHADLVAFLNDLNATWVEIARRFSTRVLIELLEASGPRIAALMTSLPPHERAVFAVAWAGEETSENWFDVGRDYTEHWHHQMQIREAVGAPLLLERRWLEPLLDLSVRALPRAYAATDSADGDALVFAVGDDAFSLVREGSWQLRRGAAPSPRVRVQTDPDTAWRILYNALPPATARARCTIEGDAALAEPLFGARSVMV